MSVIADIHPDEFTVVHHVKAHGLACFFCGDPTRSPSVFWHGATGGILLHPKCAEELGAHLCKDGILGGLFSYPKVNGIGVARSLLARVDQSSLEQL